MVLREELKGLKRLVVKVGSNVVTKNGGRCDLRRMRILVEDICELQEAGIEVVLVSSGAVNVGEFFLKRHHPPRGTIDLQQSASAIGQPKLINKYSRLFEENQRICSQILLTHDDFRKRRRFLNAKNTIEVLLRNGITPILNENDSVSYTEITVGDNDHLAASAAQMINAEALLIITSAEGLFDRDPAREGARLIKRVEYGRRLDGVDMSSKTLRGRGGMASKIQAVNKVTPLGIKAIISSKDNARLVLDPLRSQMGTYFAPKSSYDPQLRKAWLISTQKLNCYIEVDKGAFEALRQGRSLFPRGVVAAGGEFFQGDCVNIRHLGKTFAVGVSEYDSADVEQIKQLHSDEIEKVLGHKNSCQIVSSTNLALRR